MNDPIKFIAADVLAFIPHTQGEVWKVEKGNSDGA